LKNGKKMYFRPLTLGALCLTSLVIHYIYKGQQFLGHNVDLLGIKRRRALCRIQKNKFSFVKFAPKKLLAKKDVKKLLFEVCFKRKQI
jgi:hypothetical protein